VPENGRGARERRGDWRADYAALGGAALVAAMRQGDARALEEFIARHRALLVHEARRCGIPEGEREDAAAEVLHDTAVRLMTTRSAAPRSLAAYLATALRRRAQNAARERRRRERREGDAADAAGADPSAAGGPGERAALAACSEGAARDARAPDDAEAAMPAVAPALARLAAALDRGLGDAERQLLRWMESHVPQSLMAQWLGISQGAAALRVWRLRARLREAAARYAAGLGADERRELLRFFRRAPAPGADAVLRELELLAGADEGADGGATTDGPDGGGGRSDERA